jgi:hypothetical protein
MAPGDEHRVAEFSRAALRSQDRAARWPWGRPDAVDEPDRARHRGNAAGFDHHEPGRRSQDVDQGGMSSSDGDYDHHTGLVAVDLTFEPNRALPAA